jgi:hypothetical protein
MLTEGFLAVIVILACAAGSAWASRMADGSGAHRGRRPGPHAMSGRRRLGRLVARLRRRLRQFPVTAARHPRRRRVALMGVLVASFAGTTMDTACRLQRYVIQELGRCSAPPTSCSGACRSSSSPFTSGAAADPVWFLILPDDLHADHAHVGHGLCSCSSAAAETARAGSPKAATGSWPASAAATIALEAWMVVEAIPASSRAPGVCSKPNPSPLSPPANQPAADRLRHSRLPTALGARRSPTSHSPRPCPEPALADRRGVATGPAPWAAPATLAAPVHWAVTRKPPRNTPASSTTTRAGSSRTCVHKTGSNTPRSGPNPKTANVLQNRMLRSSSPR